VNKDNQFESRDIEFSYLFKKGERTIEYDDLMIELFDLANESRKKRLGDKTLKDE
jgi:hypothetical protein